MPEIISDKSTSSIDAQCPIKLDNLSLQTIRFARRNVHEAVVMTYLMEIAKNAENVKVIVVSPQFSDQFKDCSGSATPKLEPKKGCSIKNAYEFTYYNRDDFEIALIPIHTHKPDHWSLGILDRRYNNTLRFYELTHKLTPWQDALLTHSVSTLSPTEKFEPIWVKPEVTSGLKKYTWDAHYNTGVYICVTAKKYVENNGPFVEEVLDLDKERSKMFEFLKDLVPEEDVRDRKSLGRQSSNGSSVNLKKQEVKQEVNEVSHKALRSIETCDLPTTQIKLPELPIELEIKSELDEHQVFEVDKVLDYRVGLEGKRYFLVSWKGFPETENSWEPEDNILFDAQNFLKTLGIPSGEPNGLKTPMTARKRPGKRRTSTRFTHKKRRFQKTTSTNPVLIKQHVDNNTTSQDTSQETFDTPQESSKNGDSTQAPSNEASQDVAQVPSNEASQDAALVLSNGEANLQENPTHELSINNEYGLVEHPAKLISHHLIKADGHPYIFRITDRRKATKLLCACQTCLTIQQRASLQRKRSGSGITYTIGTLIFQPHRDMLLGDPACPRGTPHCCGEKIPDSLKTQEHTEPSSIPSIPAPSIEPPSTKSSSDENDLEDAPHENVINFTSLLNKKPFPRSSSSTMVGQAPFARPSTSKNPFLRPRLSNANEAAVQKKNTPQQNHKVVKVQNTLASNMNRDDETSIFKPIFISSNLVKVEGYPYTFFVKSKSERSILRCQDCQEIVEKAKQTSQLIPAVGHIILDKKEGLIGDPTKPSNIPHICKFKQAIRPKKIIKRRKRKSAAWKYADQLEAGFIKCKLCGMVRQSFGGTSVIIQHLKNDHYELYLKEYGGSAREGSAEKSKELVSQEPQNPQKPQKSPETEKTTAIKPISLKIKRISTNDNSLSVSYESELPNETVETALANSEPINPENEATQQSDMSDELGCAQVHITSSTINQQICINKPKSATRMNANGNNAQQENGQDINEPQNTYQAEILHIETVKKNIQSINNSRPPSTYQGQKLQPIPNKQSTHSSTTQPQEPILDFTPVNSIGSFERQALEEIAAANTSSQSPHPSTSTTSEINEEQQWPSIPGRRSPIDIKPRFLINIPSRSYSSSYSNSPGLSPAPTSRPFENMKPKKISNFSTIRIVNARSHFTKNVDVEDCPYKFGYPHADGLAPIVQATDPEKYSNEEIDRIKYEVSEQLTKIRDENVDVASNKRKSKLLLADSLMVGLNEDSIKNCYVVHAQFPFLPSWFLKVLYKQRKLLNFFTSNIDTVFYGLGYDFLRCYKKEKTSLTVNSIIRDLDEFIGALLVPEEDQELTNVKTIAFITIPEVGILQDTLSNFNEGMRQAISKLHQTYQKTVNVQLLDWAKLVEEAENNRMLEESSSFDDRLKLLLGEMEQGYGIEFESL